MSKILYITPDGDAAEDNIDEALVVVDDEYDLGEILSEVAYQLSLTPDDLSVTEIELVHQTGLPPEGRVYIG